ncbi:MAG: bifunctional oligoribonuclease/PAP phosphatase NrnA [Acutalibacteraceae bacterium]|nr:bifunctional oligoribonuclease/PAP phosphatase NrnA [Acutalibacteraceae bacterium]
MKIEISQAVSELKNADNILILTHMNPDGDTLGSGFALLRALRKTGKKVKLLNGDKINAKYNYLFENLPQEDFEEEYIVSVDVAERKLLGDALSEKYGDRVNLSIDHHETSRRFAKMTCCEPDSASCCEIIYLIIKALGVPIDKDIASCIYTGCSTDTGCFRYSNVTKRTHLIAAELIEAGADHSMINTKMFEMKSMNNIMLETMCLSTLSFYAEGRVAVISVTQDMFSRTGTDKSALDAIKPVTRQIEGVKVGVTLREDDGKISVSLRTDADVDAASICAHFGGGGHVRAAGCEFKGKTIEEAKKTVVDYIVSIL